MILLVEAELAQAKLTYPLIWVVYDHPLDFPNHFVARACYGEVKSLEIILADDLERLRNRIWQTGATYNLGRYAEDDPVILECWI